jgi:hypothetical protein
LLFVRKRPDVSAEPNCLLTEKTVELYLLGEQDRIVGISGYVVRARVKRE